MKLWNEVYVEIGEFSSFRQWVNKAPTWMEKGDRLVDSAGAELHCGGDFTASTVYPVKIMRRAGIDQVAEVADTLESRIQDMWHKLRDGRVTTSAAPMTLRDIDEIKTLAADMMALVRIAQE